MKDIPLPEIIRRLDGLALPRFKAVVGVARGGTVPATLAAAKLNCPLRLVAANYRGPDRRPVRPEPLVIRGENGGLGDGGDVLLVDDVSMTGKTLAAVKDRLGLPAARTLVLRGAADYVLFPELTECVFWPWTTTEEKELLHG